jgi:hypothetical protein
MNFCIAVDLCNYHPEEDLQCPRHFPERSWGHFSDCTLPTTMMLILSSWVGFICLERRKNGAVPCELFSGSFCTPWCLWVIVWLVKGKSFSLSLWDIPSEDHIPIYLSSLLLIGIWVVCNFRLLWLKLLQTFLHVSFGGHVCLLLVLYT